MREGRGSKRPSSSERLDSRSPSDWNRINILERWDVAFWCRTLQCTQADLELAVATVGPVVNAVRSWLARR
jgi:hypothetical protein